MRVHISMTVLSLFTSLYLSDSLYVRASLYLTLLKFSFAITTVAVRLH